MACTEAEVGDIPRHAGGFDALSLRVETVLGDLVANLIARKPQQVGCLGAIAIRPSQRLLDQVFLHLTQIAALFRQLDDGFVRSPRSSQR